MINEVAIILRQPSWKKILIDVMVRFGIIPKDFTGRVVLHVSDGAISSTEITQQVR